MEMVRVRSSAISAVGYDPTDAPHTDHFSAGGAHTISAEYPYTWSTAS